MQFFKLTFRENRLVYLEKKEEIPLAAEKGQEKIGQKTEKEKLELLNEISQENKKFLEEFEREILDDKQRLVITKMTKPGKEIEEIMVGDDDLKTIAFSIDEADSFFDEAKKEELEKKYNAIQAIKLAIKAKKQAEELYPENDQMTDEQREEVLEKQKKYIKTAAAIHLMDSMLLTEKETTEFIKENQIVEEALSNEKKYSEITEEKEEFNTNLINTNFFVTTFSLLGSKKLQMEVLKKLQQEDKEKEGRNIKKALYFLSLQKIVDEDFMREILIHKDYFNYSLEKADKIIKEIQTRVSKEENGIDEKKEKYNGAKPRIEKMKNGIILEWKKQEEKEGKGVKEGKEALDELGFPKEERIRWIKYKQPEKYSTNKFVKFFTLKNIILLELLGRMALYTAILNVAVDLDTLIKNPSVGLKNILKNPYVLGGLAADVGIIEAVAPEDYKISKMVGLDKYNLMISGFSINIFDKEITKSDSDEILVLGLLGNEQTFNFIRDKFSSLTLEQKEEALGGDIKDFFGEFYNKIPSDFKNQLDKLNGENPEKVLKALSNAYVFMRKNSLTQHERFYSVQQGYMKQRLFK